MKKYIVYKTTCIVTDCFYIGTQTISGKRDEKYYLGSGKLLIESRKRYGRENHIKQTLAEFDNHQDATTLERQLIREAKILDKDQGTRFCLNIGYGGGFYDYLSQNDVNHSERGKKATPGLRATAAAKKAEREAEYYADPKLCLNCNKPIPYDRHTENSFCCQSCAASYNNRHRNVTFKQLTVAELKNQLLPLVKSGEITDISSYLPNYKIFTCSVCGEKLIIPKSETRKYCSNRCQRKDSVGITPLGKLILANAESIRQRADNGERLEDIGKDFGTCKQVISDFLNGKLYVINKKEKSE